ncbi:MAG: FmdB family zinc ribbon protein [Acidobacteriota bacterium]
MPIYEYQCQQCDRRSEEIQRMSDPPLTECSECGGSLKKLLSSPAFQFKGSGWYVTDYARAGSGGDGKSSSDSGEAKKSEGESKSKSSKDSAGKASTATKSEKKGD